VFVLLIGSFCKGLWGLLLVFVFFLMQQIKIIAVKETPIPSGMTKNRPTKNLSRILAYKALNYVMQFHDILDNKCSTAAMLRTVGASFV
jgi:hypothetical protein